MPVQQSLRLPNIPGKITVQQDGKGAYMAHLADSAVKMRHMAGQIPPPLSGYLSIQ
ncbi:hypothetical protein [Thiolapillus sp.]|uniref:hypothetical protein n=1 Tax=Thiolapillus sp. TaxID=2017437 RepID=UPI0025E2CD4D|nr:hypothetical protein [Thiolapillus sp.]